MDKKVVCIDSDGCVMDTMNYKHDLCFGPLASEVFAVPEADRALFEELWQKTNLFAATRGINRFKGLYLSFEAINQVKPYIKTLDAVKDFCNKTTELSNKSLQKFIDADPSNQELKLALEWSQRVNEKIESLHGYDKPFEGARDFLQLAKSKCDVVIVSSANKEAIMNEWSRHDLIRFTDEQMGQDAGSKKECIAKLIAQGYKKHNILMIGDSPGDLEAAQANGVHFYPIMFGDEKASFDALQNGVLDAFLTGTYADQEYIDAYNKKFVA